MFSVRLPEFTRSTTFRWTLVLASAFALAIFGSFAFVYVQAIDDILTPSNTPGALDGQLPIDIPAIPEIPLSAEKSTPAKIVPPPAEKPAPTKTVPLPAEKPAPTPK